MSNADWWAKRLGGTPPPSPYTQQPERMPQTPPQQPQYPQQPVAPPPTPPHKASVSEALHDESLYERRKQVQATRSTFCPSCGGDQYIARGGAAPLCFGCGYRSTSAGGTTRPGDNAGAGA